MKGFIHLLFFVFLSTQLQAQDFTGQWKGTFTDNSTAFVGWGGDRCEYVLEIECHGTRVTGYSYTYFSDGGKRYYTICKLTGKLNKSSKYIEIKETGRTKTNVPANIRNCFQIHRLSYFQKDDEQMLEGTWVPVPNQEGDCGFGTTLLSRRLLQKNPSYYNSNTTKTNPQKSKTPVVKAKPKKSSPQTVKQQPKKNVPPPVVKKQPENTTPPVVKNEINKITETPQVQTEPQKVAESKTEPIVSKTITEEKVITDPKYEKRNSDLIKTIEIDNASFTVDLYDNGEIDGDSISLFFNGRLLLSHKRLSDKALHLNLKIDEDKVVNELIMYAENLGTIPPNTALMLVKDGDNRYEVRISSDLQKSGVIRFIHRSKIKQ